MKTGSQYHIKSKNTSDNNNEFINDNDKNNNNVLLFKDSITNINSLNQNDLTSIMNKILSS